MIIIMIIIIYLYPTRILWISATYLSSVSSSSHRMFSRLNVSKNDCFFFDDGQVLFKRNFPKWQLPKCADSQAANSQVCLRELAALNVAHLGSCHLGNCHMGNTSLGNSPWENIKQQKTIYPPSKNRG